MHGARRCTVFWAGLFLFTLLAVLPAGSAQEPTHRPAASPDAASATGTLVIPAQFREAGPFSDGLAAVLAGKGDKAKWGYIDPLGKFVIDPRFDKAKPFSEGLAAVRDSDDKTGKWGYIDKTGKFVIPPQWDDATPFVHDLAVVRTGSIITGKQRVIDRKGRYVFDRAFGFMLPCDNGMTLVGMNVSWDDHGVNRRFGFIDKTGKFVIDPDYDDAFCFTDGWAAVHTSEVKHPGWGFIDIAGKFVLAPQWGLAGAFRNGLAAVGVSGGITPRWGAIDRAGQLIIPEEFPAPLEFHDGLALESNTTHAWATDNAGRTTVVENKRYSFVNQNGVAIFAFQWRDALPFSQGLAAVLVGDPPLTRWGYMDPTGKYVVKPQFKDARAFSENRAAVLIDDGSTRAWGYIAR